MIFERFEDQGLAQYSYAVGCDGVARLAIVDPIRTIEPYLRFAEQRGARITHVLETHIHADFASGARELADRTGAELWLSAYDAGETYEVRFDHRPMEDGDEVRLGSVRLRAAHTPGHTPEHLSYLVFDGARSKDVPMLVLTGDFLFVGSLGRPDLLGEDQKVGLAEQMFDSREKLRELPDGLEVHPGHGAGSMCGSGMGGRPMSTLGFERIANQYLDPDLTREEFVDRLLANVPLRPDYYLEMKDLNAAGPPILGGLPGLRAIAAEEFRRLAAADHVVVDVRSAMEFAKAHVPGSLNIGMSSSMSQWAGWVVPYRQPLLLVAPDEATVGRAIESLIRVGLDRVEGYLQGGIDGWRAADLPLREFPAANCAELARQLRSGDGPAVLDVRSAEEWRSGHIRGAIHIHAGQLPSRIDEIPRDGKRLAVICGTGYRSGVAASVLERAGFDDVANVIDGMEAWHAAGLPVVRE